MASFKDYVRVCKWYRANDNDCKGCPLEDKHCPLGASHDPEEADKIIDKWVAEHPQKTYMQDFFDKFPDAPIREPGIPFPCRRNVYGYIDCDGSTCEDCWNQVMPEEDVK